MSGRTVDELVPGDPERIWLLADTYNRLANICEDVGRGFRSIDDGGWYGRAAEAFHARFERQPRRFLDVADAYGQAAAALDTYAAVLAWAKRQAGEVIALGDREDPPPERPVLTAGEQAVVAGVISGAGEPEPVRADQRELAVSNYRRALAMLETVGDESADTITAAGRSMPAAPVVSAARASRTPNLVVRAVLRRPALPEVVDPVALRDDPRDWAAAIGKLRKRLRWDSLDRLSPRLAQHIFEGHYRPGRKENTGYHHREGGVDRGVLRVVEVVEGPDVHGVYVAQVRGPHTPPDRVKTSTFFPDSWTGEEVLRAVRHVYAQAMRDGGTDYDPRRRRFRGVYRGVRIDGYFRRGAAKPRMCDIITAYPRGVRKSP